MKKIVLLLVVFITGHLLHAEEWTYSGEIYGGGGSKYSLKYDIDGEELKDSSFFGEGNLTLSANNGYWYTSLFSEITRDNFYQEMQAKLSCAIVDSDVGNYRVYTLYKNNNDITESDNDYASISVYAEGMKYFNESTSLHIYSSYSGTTYKERKNELFDYRTIAGSASLTYTDYNVRISSEKQLYDTGSLVPDFTTTSLVFSTSFYKDTFVSSNSLTYEIKNYDFVTSDYRSYAKIVLSTRTGYRMSSATMLYLLGSLTQQNEDADASGDGTNSLKKIGLEASIFSYPLSFIVQYGRQDYREVSTSADRLNKNIYSVDINWSYWTDRFTFFLSNVWELQKVEDIEATEYPEAKNSNYVDSTVCSVEYEWSESLRSAIDFSYEFKKHFLEDEMNANYFFYSVKKTFDYTLSFSYSLRAEATYSVSRYETFTENDTKELGLKTMIRYYF